VNRTVSTDDVAEDEMILDAGPKTIAQFGRHLQNIKTLVWNGPFGAFEIPPFDAATNAAARLVAERTQAGAMLSVAGGGDTVAALSAAGVEDKFTYVSTAGGAFLEWLEGQMLPGVAALETDKRK
jgi:phosphoglycerate kinase